MFPLITSKIQNKLIFTFSMFCLAIFSVSGLLHYWYTESSLDEELGKKLLAVAQAASLQVHTELVSKLTPGDERSRTYKNFKKKLGDLRDVTDVDRIYIMDLKGYSLLDTEEGVRVGYPYPFLKFNQFEFERTTKGLPSHSVLFESYDGKLYKTAFVPMTVNNEIRGVIAVDGSATFLYLIKRIEWHLLTVGIVGVIVSVLIGYYLARSVSNPVNQLMEAAEKIGAGNLEHPIDIKSRDEVGFLGTTMEKMRRNILKRDQYLKTMLAGVAHELRNPLGGVEIFSHLLSKEISDKGSQKSYVLKIINEVDVMKKILSDFLDFARPRVPQPQLCNVQSLVDEVRVIFGQDIDRKSIQLRTRIGAKRAYVDPGHLRQILVNLLENSIQSVNGDALISIETKENQDRIELIIEDNGHGIEEGIRDKIFDPFFTTKEKGSGLGLAIVKKLVEENHGDIGIESNGLNGTRCVVVFPATETPQKV